MAKEKRLKPDSPSREVWEVGRGDFVLVNGRWLFILSNSAEGQQHPKRWTIRTDEGSWDMWTVQRYAKAEDFQ